MLPRRALVRRLRGIQPDGCGKGRCGLLIVLRLMESDYPPPTVIDRCSDFWSIYGSQTGFETCLPRSPDHERYQSASCSADIDLSRDNATLNEFVLVEEQKPEQNRIRSHVVLKADVRGSQI